jgi:hypothetical protein
MIKILTSFVLVRYHYFFNSKPPNHKITNLTHRKWVAATAAGALSIFAFAPASADPVGDDIDALAVVVTLTKAQLADRAMNAILSPGMPPPIPLKLDGVLTSSAASEFKVDGGTVFVTGAARNAFPSPGGSSTRLIVENDGEVINSTGPGGGGFVFQGNGSAGEMILRDGGLITTSGASSAAFDGGGSDSAMGVQITSGGYIVTTGDDSPAVDLGEATDSVAIFEAQGRPMDKSVIYTSGDRSPGIDFSGEGRSTFTATITDAPTTAAGPGYLTEGNDSTLINVSTPIAGTSSFSLSAERTGFETRGDGSGVINLVPGSSSDALIHLQDVTLKSSGANSQLLNVEAGDASVINAIVIDSNLQAGSDGSGGIRLEIGRSSSMVTFLSNTDVVTSGNDAAALETRFSSASVNENSNQNMVILNSSFTSTGARSGGVLVGGLGNGSASDLSIDTITISTGGDDSSGLAIGAMGDGSAKSTTVAHTTILTKGNDSTAFEEAGIVGDNSVFVTDILDTDLSTQGDRSAGLIQRNLGGSSSVTVLTFDDVDVRTTGNDSAGIIIDSFDANSENTAFTLNGESIQIRTSGLNSDGMILGARLGTSTPGTTMVTSDVRLSGLDILTTGNSADAVVIGAGATITDIDGPLATFGESAHGIKLLSDPSVLIPNTLAYKGTIVTSGAGSHGISGEGGAFDVKLTGTGSIMTTGANADGIRIAPTGSEASSVRNDGSITAAGNGISLGASAATAPTLNINNTGMIAGDIGVAVDGSDLGSQHITNSGAITGLSGTALSLAGGLDSLELLEGGVIHGLADLGAGIDSLFLNGNMASLVGGSPGADITVFGTTALDFEQALFEGASFFDGGGGEDVIIFDGLLDLGNIFSFTELSNAGMDAYALGFTNLDDSASWIAFRDFESFRFGDGTLMSLDSLKPVPIPGTLPLFATALMLLFKQRRRNI